MFIWVELKELARYARLGKLKKLKKLASKLAWGVKGQMFLAVKSQAESSPHPNVSSFNFFNFFNFIYFFNSRNFINFINSPKIIFLFSFLIFNY